MYRLIVGNCGGVTRNWWKTLSTIVVNCGGVTLKNGKQLVPLMLTVVVGHIESQKQLPMMVFGTVQLPFPW